MRQDAFQCLTTSHVGQSDWTPLIKYCRMSKDRESTVAWLSRQHKAEWERQRQTQFRLGSKVLDPRGL